MRRLRWALLALLAVIALIAAYLLLWPVAIDPVAWTPPPAPARDGPYAPNDRLRAVERIAVGGRGPETTAIDAQGRVYTGLEDGRIVRLTPGSPPAELARTGGRPLGVALDAAGHLLIADGVKGLLRTGADGGDVEVLAAIHDGRRIGLADDLDLGPDGTVYFSDASTRFGLGDSEADIVEHGANGRLLAWDPRTGQTRLLLDQLYFPNGIAVAPDGQFVLVNETSAYRVLRYWLTGPRAGQHDVLIDNLPGFPDGISTGTGGVYWIALFAPRSADLDRLAGRPFLRKVAARLPTWLRPRPEHHAWVVGVDADGKVVYSLEDASAGSYAPITSVEERGGYLYLGALGVDAVARLPRP